MWAVIILTLHVHSPLNLLLMDHHQLLPIYRSKLIMADVHDDVAQAAELCPTKGIGEEVTVHFIGWEILQRDVFSLLDIRSKKIPDLHVASSLAA